MKKARKPFDEKHHFSVKYAEEFIEDLEENHMELMIVGILITAAAAAVQKAQAPVLKPVPVKKNK